MYLFRDDESQLVTGGLRITVSPTIAISTAVVTGLQGNNGTSLGIGVLGDGASGLTQVSGLDLATYRANFSF